VPRVERTQALSGLRTRSLIRSNISVVDLLFLAPFLRVRRSSRRVHACARRVPCTPAHLLYVPACGALSL